MDKLIRDVKMFFPSLGLFGVNLYVCFLLWSHLLPKHVGDTWWGLPSALMIVISGIAVSSLLIVEAERVGKIIANQDRQRDDRF